MDDIKDNEVIMPVNNETTKEDVLLEKEMNKKKKKNFIAEEHIIEYNQENEQKY